MTTQSAECDREARRKKKLAAIRKKQSESESSEQNEPVLAIMGRFYPFDDSGIPFAGTNLVIKERQNQATVSGDDDGGTGLNVWDGAMLLARYLENMPGIVKDKRVLELGSGCGLVGIVSGILGAKEVVMTDLSYALPLMVENVRRNQSSWMGDNVPCNQIECKECDWFNPPPINEMFVSGSIPDVILVADCVWISPLIAPLLRTLKAYTTHSHCTRVLVTYQQRGRDAHEEFLRGLYDLFDVKVIDTEKTAGLVKPDVFYVFDCSKKKQ